MRHYIAYHNRDKMGEPSCPSQAYTNKPLRDPMGIVVWIIEGLGCSPKQYNLVSRFTVSRIEKSPDTSFATALYGEEEGFKEHIRLNELEWFPNFRREMGNFAVGLQPIRDEEVVSHLERIAAREGLAPE